MEGYWTVKEYAVYKGKHRQAIYRLLWAGKIKAVRVGTNWLIPMGRSAPK